MLYRSRGASPGKTGQASRGRGVLKVTVRKCEDHSGIQRCKIVVEWSLYLPIFFSFLMRSGFEEWREL